MTGGNNDERENESKSNKFIFDTLLGSPSKWIFLFSVFLLHVF